MIKGNRPTQPACLSDAKTESEQRKAKEYYEFDAARIPAFTFNAYRARGVKDALEDMFQGKCAFCESQFVNHGVHIEHFRPKGGVQPQRSAAMQAGYWWLACQWENLLPTCIGCNTEATRTLPDGSRKMIGKGNYFPLSEGQQHATSEGYLHTETPLLINPGMINPARYFEFSVANSLGKTYSLIHPREIDADGKMRAELSIDAYGLNRHRLVATRTARLKDLETDLQDWRTQLLRMESTSNSVEKEEFRAEVQKRLETILKRYVDRKSPFSAACFTFVRDWLKQHQLGKPPEQLQTNDYGQRVERSISA